MESQEQSRYAGWHAEVLPEIGESKEVFSLQDIVDGTFVVGIDEARQGTILQLVPSLWWSEVKGRSEIIMTRNGRRRYEVEVEHKRSL